MNGIATQQVLVADGQRMSRLGIRIALQRAGLEVIAEVSTAMEAVAGAMTHHPDACVLDLSVRGDGLSAVRQIKRNVPDTVVVVLSETPDSRELVDALRAGVSGYISNEIEATPLVAVLQAALCGSAAIPRAMAAGLVEDVHDRERRRRQQLEQRLQIHLTSREWDVMNLLRRGFSTQEVAAELGISLVTVRRHAADAAHKLGVGNRTAALARLRQADSEARPGAGRPRSP